MIEFVLPPLVKMAFSISLLSTGLAAVGAQNVVSVGEETLSNESDRAFLAVEMLVVPVTVFEGDVLRASQSGDRFRALEALLSKEVAKAIGTIRLFLL